MLQKYPGDAWLIEETYKLSASTLHCISRADVKSLWNLSKWMWDAIKAEGVSAQVGQTIQSILRQPRTPITLSEIQVEVNERQDTSVWKSRIRRYIKGVMKFSYTKGSSRPPKVLSDQNRTSKACFWVDLLSLLMDDAYIVNVDKSWFNRSLKQMYSWLPKGKGGSIVHESWKGRSSLLLGVWAAGGWVGMVKSGTVKSREFLVFAKILERIIRSWISNENRQLVILLDNAPTHSSRSAMNVYGDMSSRFMFLPPYSPEVAPVELYFGAIKRKMRRQLLRIKIDFDKQEGADAILHFWAQIKESSCIKFWLEAVKEWWKVLVGD